MMEFARTIAKAIGWQAPASSAAAQSAAAKSSLAVANEIPRSVVNSETPTVSVPITAKAGAGRVVKVDKGTRASRSTGSGDATAKRTPTAAGSGKASSARTKPARAAS